jgi:SAM-dependent methyltransferase
VSLPRKVEVNRPCIVCGRAEPDPTAFSLRFPDFGYPGEFRILACGGCRLLYNSPRLDEASLDALYDHNYYLFQEPEAVALARIVELHQQTVRSLDALVDDREVLEVGCAKGYMLALLRARGWRVRGVELSPFAAGFARTVFGLEVFQGSLEAFAASHQGLGLPAAVSTDVIEHVPDPPRFLEALAAVLRPGGVLLLGTPNADAEGIRLKGGDWLGFNPFHIWCFSRETLLALLERAGFEVVDAYTYQNGSPQGRPRPQGLAGLVRGAIPGFALRSIRALRRELRDRADRRSLPLIERIRDAAATAGSQPAFAETSDGLHADARACRGENLVVIARRRSRS